MKRLMVGQRLDVSGYFVAAAVAEADEAPITACAIHALKLFPVSEEGESCTTLLRPVFAARGIPARSRDSGTSVPQLVWSRG